ncbi:Ktr system potassium transporter B [Paenibacillus sp. IB182496]|uniref:Ktr system potassium transporter B n=1 Tax=Paenibacillus sabuli TaxID=2772509 RepID=A0A927BTA7_9BACL|nr:TrkH family potassium uptake protein [Paenibacillus sabuli]MBD2845375.1 Ktr system potassium transporter B [Paenibacillus sabuli]
MGPKQLRRRLQKHSLTFTPSRILLTGFALPLLIGAVLLALPAAAASGRPIAFVDAVFTAASAVSVTGLVVLDTGSDFTLFGQLVILFLIQLGGLGFMTYGVVIAVLVGRRIGLKDRLLLQQSTGALSTQGVVRLSLAIAFIALLIESAGALVLTLRWSGEMGLGQAAYYGAFHAISAFNNAGFALWPDSLTGYAGDPVVNVVICGLFIAGGLGFLVILELWRSRSWRKLSLHARVVLATSGLLCCAGFAGILLIEVFNPETLGGMSWNDRLWTAFFQGVVTRTAGFNSIDVASMMTASQFFMIFLMFIGASSGSTGGGIKTTTFAVLVATLRATIRGRSDVQLMNRRLPVSMIMRALAVTVVSLGIVLTSAFLLTITEHSQQKDFMEVLFEATSAFGTVGMSMGLTADLSPVGKWIVILTMYIGRLGPLTLAFALYRHQVDAKFRLPEEKVMIG